MKTFLLPFFVSSEERHIKSLSSTKHVKYITLTLQQSFSVMSLIMKV